MAFPAEKPSFRATSFWQLKKLITALRKQAGEVPNRELITIVVVGFDLAMHRCGFCSAFCRYTAFLAAEQETA